MKNQSFRIILFVALAGFARCNKPSETLVEEETSTHLTLKKSQLKEWGISLDTLVYKEFENKIQATGMVDVPPQSLVSINAVTEGFIKGLKVYPGSKVGKGSVLCYLEHPGIIQVQQEWIEQSNKVEYLEREKNRQLELFQGQATSEKNYQKAETDFKMAKGLLATIEAKVLNLGLSIKELKAGKVTAKIAVKAPISGNVKSVLINEGKLVQPFEPLFDLVDKDHLHLELRVFEKDIQELRDGAPIIFEVPSNIELGKMTAKVFLSGKSLEPENRTVNVHGHLEPERTDLLPGMYVNAEISGKKSIYAAIADGAVFEDEGKHFVYGKLAKEGNDVFFKRYPVKVLSRTETLIAIDAKQVPKGTLLVGKGAYYLHSQELKNAGGEE